MSLDCFCPLLVLFMVLWICYCNQENIDMSVVALSAASVFISDPQFLNGVGVPVIASAGSLLNGNTGFTFPWAAGVMVYYVGATSNTTTLTMVNPNNSALNVTTASLTAAIAYMFGPISSTFCSG